MQKEPCLQEVPFSRLDLRCRAIDSRHLRARVIQGTEEEDVTGHRYDEEAPGGSWLWMSYVLPGNNAQVPEQRWSSRPRCDRGGSLAKENKA